MKQTLKLCLSKIVLLLSFVLLIFTSCKKEPPLSNKQEKTIAIKNNTTTPEKVNVVLLQKYIDYQMKLEANALLEKSGKNVEFLAPKMDRKEFDLMIKNYLVNEKYDFIT